MSTKTTVLLCECTFHHTLPEDQKKLLISSLTGRDEIELVCIPDLCKVAAEQQELLEELVERPELCIVGCYSRALRWLFHGASAKLDLKRTRLFNLRTQSAGEILQDLGVPEGADEAEPSVSSGGNWQPWYPVIDFERCSNCRQCLSFCLFDVYGLDEDGTVEVTHPQNCKNNCPACARICPDVAIVFPKFDESPYDGSPVEDELMARERAKIALEQSQSSDIYATLADRARRRRLLKPDVRDQIVGKEEDL